MNIDIKEIGSRNTELLSYNGIDYSINHLDFSMIKMKLSHSKDGAGWSKEQCDIAEMQYKRFLTLLKLYPTKSIVPDKTMDTFWHYHILDTRKYHKDSIEIFGEYLHHFPYFGLRGEQDKQNLLAAFEETKSLFFLQFGIEMNISSGCDSDGGGNCTSSCGSQSCSR